MTFARGTLLWVLFILICVGLGYPILNRYDPTKLEGTSDVAKYQRIVTGSQPKLGGGDGGAFARLTRSENYYRVLVPYVAKPFYWLARGRVGTWDAPLFGLLMANAIFTATAASLLVSVGRRLRLDNPTALLGAALYLLNFVQGNLSLAGLVDSGEGCFLMAVVWSLLAERWFLLPVWAVFGALAKETFAPLSVMFVFGWWLSEARHGRLQLSRLAWICALAVTSLTVVILSTSITAGGMIWPWQLAGYLAADAGILAGLWRCIHNHTFWYVFIWLLPLGIPRLTRLPRPWVVASALAFCGALAMGAYNNAGDNTARALFNVTGPMLSLSAAIFLAGLAHGAERPGSA
jgi:hypothetical protein